MAIEIKALMEEIQYELTQSPSRDQRTKLETAASICSGDNPQDRVADLKRLLGESFVKRFETSFIPAPPRPAEPPAPLPATDSTQRGEPAGEQRQPPPRQGDGEQEQ